MGGAELSLQELDKVLLRTAFLFLSQGCIGSFLMLYLMPRQAGQNFFSMMALKVIAPVAALTLYLCHASHTTLKDASHALMTWETITFLLFLVFTVLYGFGVNHDSPAATFVPMLLATTVGFSHLVIMTKLQAHPGEPSLLLPVRLLSTLLGALFLGAATCGMILGHWYLVTPRMPIEPLGRVTRLLFLLFAINALAFLLSVARLDALPRAQVEEALRLLFGKFKMFLYGRLLIGCLGTLVVNLVTWFLVREAASNPKVKGHAVQAATGFLYLAMLTVMVGELSRCILAISTPIPL